MKPLRRHRVRVFFSNPNKISGKCVRERAKLIGDSSAVLVMGLSYSCIYN